MNNFSIVIPIYNEEPKKNEEVVERITELEQNLTTDVDVITETIKNTRGNHSLEMLSVKTEARNSPVFKSLFRRSPNVQASIKTQTEVDINLTPS